MERVGISWRELSILVFPVGELPISAFAMRVVVYCTIFTFSVEGCLFSYCYLFRWGIANFLLSCSMPSFNLDQNSQDLVLLLAVLASSSKEPRVHPTINRFLDFGTNYYKN